ncbi:hypothetical protein D3C86_2077540 [compost metagenome]
MASRSVCDIGGRVFWNQLNSGSLKNLRRRSGSNNGAATAAINTQYNSSSQPGARLKAPIATT